MIELYTFENEDIINKDGETIFEVYTLDFLLETEFILIEEEPKEIDIQGIEEITIRLYQGFSNICEYIEGKTNEILEAVKYLDRKIKEGK